APSIPELQEAFNHGADSIKKLVRKYPHPTLEYLAELHERDINLVRPLILSLDEKDARPNAMVLEDVVIQLRNREKPSHTPSFENLGQRMLKYLIEEKIINQNDWEVYVQSNPNKPFQLAVDDFVRENVLRKHILHYIHFSPQYTSSPSGLQK